MTTMQLEPGDGRSLEFQVASTPVMILLSFCSRVLTVPLQWLNHHRPLCASRCHDGEARDYVITRTISDPRWPTVPSDQEEIARNRWHQPNPAWHCLQSTPNPHSSPLQQQCLARPSPRKSAALQDLYKLKRHGLEFGYRKEEVIDG